MPEYTPHVWINGKCTCGETMDFDTYREHVMDLSIRIPPKEEE